MNINEIARHARRCAQQCRDEGRFDIAGGFDEIARMLSTMAELETAHGEERKPDGYAYRYPDGYIRHNGVRPHNSMDPVEAIPFYYGKQFVELRVDMRDGGCIIRDREGNRITTEQLMFQHDLVTQHPEGSGHE